MATAEKQIRSIVNILEVKIKQLNSKAAKSESMKSQEVLAQKMIAALEQVLNPEACQRLNTTIEASESSSEEVFEQDDDQVTSTIGRSQSGKQRIAKNKEQQLAEVVRKKDAIIEGLYLKLGEMTVELEDSKAMLRKKLEEVEEITVKQVEELVENDKNLKDLLDTSNETNLELAQALKIAKDDLVQKELLIAELLEKIHQDSSLEVANLKADISNLLKENDSINKTLCALQLELKKSSANESSLIVELQKLDKELHELRGEALANTNARDNSFKDK